MEKLLSLQNLSIDYRTGGGMLSAVRNVNLDIDRGEILAVVGESGCGKSTAAHAVMRLLPKDSACVSGRILFSGCDLLEMSERDVVAVRGRHIGMIFQNPLDSLNPVATCGQQVMEAIMLDGASRQAARRRAAQLFADVKMPDPERQLERYPHELSGGLRQRVMIAMMLARSPELLIADEPTTALDVTIEAQIMDILSDLREEKGPAIMLITHNFGIVAENADRIAVMYAGQLVEQGSVFEIFDSPAHPYTRMLMSALPRRPKSEGRLSTIDGTVPLITDASPGCRFANRCPYCIEGTCTGLDAPIRTLGDTHTCACHLTEEELKWSSR